MKSLSYRIPFVAHVTVGLAQAIGKTQENRIEWWSLLDVWLVCLSATIALPNYLISQLKEATIRPLFLSLQTSILVNFKLKIAGLRIPFVAPTGCEQQKVLGPWTRSLSSLTARSAPNSGEFCAENNAHLNGIFGGKYGTDQH